MRVALIGPAFFGYPERIVAGLARRGVPAAFHDERPSNRVAAKLALRMAGPATRGRVVAAHHRRIAARLARDGATHALLISPQTIPPAFVADLGRAGIRTCLYAWDSLANRATLAPLLGSVDAAASFDPSDCERLGLPHVPLFGPADRPSAADTVPEAPGDGPGRPRDIDLLFCATMHSDRPRWLHRIRRAALDHGWSVEVMAFYHSRSLWLVRNAASPGLWGQVGGLRTRMFTAAEIAAATARARVVVDVPHPRQTGLTMRCFEALAGGAVVLTSDRSGARGLPPALAARVLPLGRGADPAELARRMRAALDHPPRALPRAARDFLTLDRFLDQILAVMAPQADAAPGDPP